MIRLYNPGVLAGGLIWPLETYGCFVTRLDALFTQCCVLLLVSLRCPCLHERRLGADAIFPHLGGPHRGATCLVILLNWACINGLINCTLLLLCTLICECACIIYLYRCLLAAAFYDIKRLCN